MVTLLCSSKFATAKIECSFEMASEHFFFGGGGFFWGGYFALDGTRFQTLGWDRMWGSSMVSGAGSPL